MDSDHKCSVAAFGSRVELFIHYQYRKNNNCCQVFLIDFLMLFFIVQRHNFKLRILILPSTQTPEALQTGYRGRWRKRFEVIAHFSGEKGSDCLRSPSLPPRDSLACHWRKKGNKAAERKTEKVRERVREDSVAVQLLLWMFLDYISAAERKERRTDRKGIRGRRERGTLHKSGLLFWEGGWGSLWSSVGQSCHC